MDEPTDYHSADEQAKAEMLQRASKNAYSMNSAAYYASINGRSVEEAAYGMSAPANQGQINTAVSLAIGLVLFVIIGIPCLIIFLF